MHQNNMRIIAIKDDGMIKKIDHFVITTKNIKTCLEFYKKLGFTVKNSGSRYELFAGDFKINMHILGGELSPHAVNVQPGSADICFEVDNILEYKKILENQKLETELGIVDRTGVNGSMQSIYLRDPDGNLVEFCSYE